MDDIKMRHDICKLTKLFLASKSTCGNERYNKNEGNNRRIFGIYSLCKSIRYCSNTCLIQHWFSHKRWCIPTNDGGFENNEEEGASLNDGLEPPQLGPKQVD